MGLGDRWAGSPRRRCAWGLDGGRVRGHHDLMSDERAPSRTLLIGLIGGVVLVVVIALIAVFVSGGTTEFAEDSPEGVVQRYSQAVIDGDIETARTYLVPEIGDECERTGPGQDQLRVTLLESTETADAARVRVIIVTSSGSGPFGTSEYESEERFGLVRSGGSWLIEATPWQLTVCVESGMR